MDLPRILASTGVILAVVTACRWSQAANICSEAVPTNRMVDGIPAYAQCTDSTSSAIYSNNGVDTATTSGGTGWVRTQMSGGYQCTELAHRYMAFKWNVQGVPNGNAGTWCDGTIPNGLVKSTTPTHGDLIVFAPGSCGADATTGHVAVVDVVNSDATVAFVEQNSAGRRKCQVSTAACFLHAVANNGSTLDGGAPSDAATDVPSTDNRDAFASRDALPRTDGLGSPDRMPSGTGGVAATGGTLGAVGGAGAGGATGVASSRGSGGTPGAGGALGSGGALADAAATSAVSGTGGTTSLASGTPNDSSSACACRLTASGQPKRKGAWPIGFASLAIILAKRRIRRIAGGRNAVESRT